MPDLFSLLGLAIVLAVHTGIAAILTRLFRVRLSSRLGPVLYSATLTPLVLLLSTLVFTGVLGIGPNLGEPGTAVFVLILGPLIIGVTVDYVWMPAPEDVEVPDTV